MANQPETNDSSVFPESFPLAPDFAVGPDVGPDVDTGTGASEEPTSTREDSGLLDLLSVGAKIKDADDDDPIEPQSQREDSGLILFTAGDFGTAPSEGTADAARLADDDDGMFGSFAGGIGGGFGNLSEPNIGDDLTPMGGAGSVAESRPAEVRPAAVEEPKRNPLTALAVVLGLAVVAAGAVYLTDKDQQPKPQQAQAEMTAKPIDDAAVGKAEADPVDPIEANSGAAPIPEPIPEPEPEAETEGALDPDGLLAAADTSADDPMAQKDALLSGSGTKPGGKTGKWEQGEPQAGTSTGGVVDDPDPDPDPIADPKPVEGGKKPPGPVNDDEVDCLLNPDLDKCTGGGGGGGGGGEVLAPKIPEKLDSGQLRDGFNTVKSKAKACGSKFGAEPGTKVKVHASIEGATGKVTAVSAQGDHAGTDLGKCVEDVVKDATFSAFKKPSQGVDYSMIM